MIADQPAETAPTDGRVIRGWFTFAGGAEFAAVSWDRERATWVTLGGEPMPAGHALEAWAAD